jgi:hypothetical protein
MKLFTVLTTTALAVVLGAGAAAAFAKEAPMPAAIQVTVGTSADAFLLSGADGRRNRAAPRRAVPIGFKPGAGEQMARRPKCACFVAGNRPGQTKASRFLLTNSSTVIGGRPPISAI